jgi:hypothetical protein
MIKDTQLSTLVTSYLDSLVGQGLIQSAKTTFVVGYFSDRPNEYGKYHIFKMYDDGSAEFMFRVLGENRVNNVIIALEKRLTQNPEIYTSYVPVTPASYITVDLLIS